jgi:hypothetical protein
MLLSLLAFAVCSSAQASKTVIRATAFFTVPTPGTIMVDENGNPRQTQRQKVYTVFVEIKGTTPAWTKAWTDNKTFSVLARPVSGGSAVAGKRKTDDKRLVVKSSGGNVLQQLEFSPAIDQRSPQLVGPNEILLAGRVKGKTFYYKISALTELASPEYQ